MNQVTQYVGEGETVEAALEAALSEMGVSADVVDYEVLDEPGRKVFGLGGKAARVRAWLVEARTDEFMDATTDANAIVAGSPAGADSVPATADAHEGELTDEQIDEIADTAGTVLKTIVGYCGVEEFEIEEYEGDEGELILDLVGPNLAFIIGRHGRTLEALQTVAGAIITKKTGVRHPVMIDVEGYKHRRRQKVVEIALRAADRAVTQGRSVPLKPMTASERRMVHVALREHAGVATASEGSGEYRHVVISHTG